MYHAGWMSKAFYILKIYTFRIEFKLTSIEIRGIRNLSIFIVKIYVMVDFFFENAHPAVSEDATNKKFQAP